MTTDRRFYTLVLPNATQSEASLTSEQNITTQSALDEDSGSSEAVSTDPDSIQLDGLYGGQYAEKMAVELAEVAQGMSESALPLVGESGRIPEAGYYYAESVDVNPASPQTDNLWEYNLSLTKNGTRGDRRRALETDPKTRTHEFGNTETGHISAPATASKLVWVNRDQTQAQTATPDQTVSTEFGDVHLFDVEAAPYEPRPYLAYAVDYEEEGKTDCRVWDTRGNDSREAAADGSLQWQKVFVSAHDFSGPVAVSNGRLRVTLDESANTTSAERWDDAAGAWSDVALNASDWQLFDVDLSHPGAAMVRARLTFENTTDNSLFDLEAVLHRGWDDVQFYAPGDPPPEIPSGLVDRLKPIASARIVDPQPERTLLKREVLR